VLWVSVMTHAERIYLLFGISDRKGIVVGRVVPSAGLAEAEAVAHGLLRCHAEVEFVEIQLDGELMATVGRTDRS